MIEFDTESAGAQEGDTIDRAFAVDVLSGLSASHRAIPARWLYDHAGSRLFEEITRLPEYYPTRTEKMILAERASEIAELTGSGRALVEFGSGSSIKTRAVLANIKASAYVPIDISGEFLGEAVEELAAAHPSLPIYPVVADFTRPFKLPNLNGAPCLGFFPGSTIGNLVAPTAVNLLRTMANSLGTDAQLLIGIDRIKSEKILIPAYDDAQRVTAQFNLNLLNRINRELDGTIPVAAFRHEARWNDEEARIEMHLRAEKDVYFTVCGKEFQMKANETIHTENSIKYGSRDARVLLRAGGWTPIKEWVDEGDLFAVILAEVTPHRSAP